MKQMRRIAALFGAALCVLVVGCGGGGTTSTQAVPVTPTPIVPPTPTVVAPSITTQPISQTVIDGQTVTFSVMASGDAPLNFQWQRNGVDISGATQAQLQFVAHAVDSAAIFKVKIGNASSVIALSDAATLTVRPPSVSLFAGKATDSANCVVADGKGTAASFCSPIGIAVAASGNVYIAESEVVRKITPDGTVTTLAGVAGNKGGVDGVGGVARFYQLHGITIDSKENIYVSESRGSSTIYSGGSAVRIIDTNGAVRTVAIWDGRLGDAFPYANVSPIKPVPLIVDAQSNVFVHSTEGFWFDVYPLNVLKVSTTGNYILGQPVFSYFTNPRSAVVGSFGSGEGALFWDVSSTKTSPTIFASMCSDESGSLEETNGTTELVWIDSSGTITERRSTSACYRVMAQDSQGAFYAVTGSVIGKLRTLDGTFTPLIGPDGALDLGRVRQVNGRWGVQALTFAPDGALYAIVGQSILRIRLP